MPTRTAAPAMPTGVALTTRSHRRRLGRRRGAPPGRPGRPGRRPSRPGPVAVDHHAPRPHRPRPRASTTARAAPPAPSTRQRRPVGSNPAPRASEARKPSPSVLSPIRTSAPPDHAVHRAEARRHRGPLVHQLGHRGLVRHGDRQAGQAQSARSPPPPPRPPRPGTGKPTETQSRPRAAKAVLCSSGESEWADRVADDPDHGGGGRRPRPAGRCLARSSQPTPRLAASSSLASCSA